MNLNKISDLIWEIPKEGGMNVLARIYASEELLKGIKNDKTLEQVKNITHFPGIYKRSIALPDAHQGYGMPIGGVVALDREEGGISPGSVGYDINCLSPDSKVLLEFGRNKKIGDLEDIFESEKATVASEKTVHSDIQLFMSKENQEVFLVETNTGEKLKATVDHPFLTEDGMIDLEDLDEGMEIYVRPFKGLPDEEPEEFVVLDEEDFKDEDPQLIKQLKKRDLLPLKSTDRKFNILLKLIGFHTGDGSFNNLRQTTFYADKEDLNEIQKDIEELGFKPSKVHSRERDHEVKGKEFSRVEHSVKSSSNAFKMLLVKLGAPYGRKTELEFTTPDYLERLANWQRALYLSAFFGAEMSSPSNSSDKNFYCPKISQNKSLESKESGRKFMEEIKEYLEELGIKTNKIESFETKQNQKGRVFRYRLGVAEDSENLIEFFTRIGYRYNLEKQRKTIKATQYLKLKQRAIERRKMIEEESIEMYNNGVSPQVVKQKFEINDRFIERSIYEERKSDPRPPEHFPDFEDFAERINVNDNLTVKTGIKSIERVGKETVYDIGVSHDAHNFIANDFVVSNCGVRLVKTPLKYDDVKPKMKKLVNTLFENVPSGVGVEAKINVSREELKEVLERGVEWAVENGYGFERDLNVIEENGRMEEADASVISDKALDRGKDQVGCLGAGNHFVEVEVVGDIKRPELAEKFGLEEGQVCLMIHTGSRGFGHQVCTDYLRKFEKRFKEQVSDLPDRELVYAPGGSQEAEQYYKAMSAAANFAWTNRQLITHWARKSFSRIFEDIDEEDLDIVYDVCHNVAKKETHEIDGEEKEVFVHRKGATRALPSGHENVPDKYKDMGQPVLIPGDMGHGSYLLVGGDKSLDLTFGSTAHGAGRVMSRTKAKGKFWGGTVQKDLEKQDIIVKAENMPVVAEEAPGAYKSLDEVVEVSDRLDIANVVLKLDPKGVVKG